MERIKKPYLAPEITSEHIQVGVFGNYNNSNFFKNGLVKPQKLIHRRKRHR